ncbi:MAG: lipoprotein-releasing system transmembrane subunit LolC [Gammaproteobacteria bacterium]|jgi:lipoprotein-releasing system permease protein|nr:lipoprotein-releasing system transmembrane subunit LolC [Gammaproteobacteria bacterium]|tara:strand:- start:901 stop:2151 length:1251 start_codon:yes stop_codon:yes gene_type:complete
MIVMILKDWRLHVAARYSLSGASDHLVSFMSLISISGLVLGVAVLVIVLSVMNGFEQELRERVLGVVPHGVVYSRVPRTDWQALMQQWKENADIKAMAPLVEGTGLALANGELAGVSYTGIDPLLESEVSILKRYFVVGELNGLAQGSFNVIIGQALATRLKVNVGDKLTLVLPELKVGLAGPMPTMKRFTISGLFKVGSDLDKSQLYIHIGDAMKIKRQPQIDGVRIRLDDLFVAPGVLHNLILTTGDSELYASSWMGRHGNLYDAIQMQKTTMFLLLLLLVAVAAFNVVSNLMMTVQDKYSDIAILRTIGASPGSIRAIFIMHGCLVGVLGITIGLVLGALLANWLGDIYGFIDESFGLGIMDEYFIQYLPTRLLAGDIVVVATVSFAICLAATIYPASKAAAANPVEALQYEG